MPPGHQGDGHTNLEWEVDQKPGEGILEAGDGT